MPRTTLSSWRACTLNSWWPWDFYNAPPQNLLNKGGHEALQVPHGHAWGRRQVFDSHFSYTVRLSPRDIEAVGVSESLHSLTPRRRGDQFGSELR